jgi:hypothetical protein
MTGVRNDRYRKVQKSKWRNFVFNKDTRAI